MNIINYSKKFRRWSLRMIIYRRNIEFIDFIHKSWNIWSTWISISYFIVCTRDEQACHHCGLTTDSTSLWFGRFVVLMIQCSRELLLRDALHKLIYRIVHTKSQPIVNRKLTIIIYSTFDINASILKDIHKYLYASPIFNNNNHTRCDTRSNRAF